MIPYNFVSVTVVIRMVPVLFLSRCVRGWTHFMPTFYVVSQATIFPSHSSHRETFRVKQANLVLPFSLGFPCL